MYIYKTINQINNKIYVGKCSNSIEESIEYLGSGLLITKAIKKYGRNNFKKIILCECSSLEELNKKEKEFIKSAKSSNEECYNIADGGDGGDIYSSLSPEKQKKFKEKVRESFPARLKGLREYIKNNPEKVKAHAKYARSKVKNHGYGVMFGEDNGFFGKTHTDEQKAKWRGVDRPRFSGKTYEEINGFEKAQQRKKKLSESLKGKKHSEEHKQNISRTLSGRKISEEAKKNRQGLKWYVNENNQTTKFKDNDPRILSGGYIRGRKWK